MSGGLWDDAGGDPVPVQSWHLSDIQSVYASTSSLAEDIRRTINDLTTRVDQNVWQGPAGDAFREKLGKLPHMIDQVSQSYGTAANALKTLMSALDDLNNRKNALAGQLGNAQSHEQLTKSRADNAPDNDPTAQRDYQGAKAAVHRMTQQVHDLADDYTTAEQQCISMLGTAKHEAIPPYSGWQSLLRGVEHLIEKCSFVLAIITIVAIVIVIAALTIVSGGTFLEILAAALVELTPLFNIATALAVAHGALGFADTLAIGDSESPGLFASVGEVAVAFAPGQLGKLAPFANEYDLAVPLVRDDTDLVSATRFIFSDGSEVISVSRVSVTIEIDAVKTGTLEKLPDALLSISTALKQDEKINNFVGETILRNIVNQARKLPPVIAAAPGEVQDMFVPLKIPALSR